MSYILDHCRKTAPNVFSNMQSHSNAEVKENRLLWCSTITNTGKQAINDLEIQIKDKDKEIENLQSKLESISIENTQIKNKYSSIKLYLRSLPTRQELTELQKCLQVSKEENQLLKDKLHNQKKTNFSLQNKAKILKEENQSLRALLNTKTNEIETLQQKVECWEQRRKAAANAGCLTMEDILAENSKVIQELQTFKKAAAEREKHLMNLLTDLETKVELYRMMASLKDDQFDQLTMQVGELQKELQQVLHQSYELEATKKDLEQDLANLKVNLKNLQSQEGAFETKNNQLCELIEQTSTCSKKLWKIVEFLQQVMMEKEVDLTLLLTDMDPEEPTSRTISSEEIALKMTNTIEKVKQIDSKLDVCRQELAKLFGERLGASVSDLCKLQ